MAIAYENCANRVEQAFHEEDNVLLNGLWHTRLSDGSRHIGDEYSWGMAAISLLAHPKAEIRDALVVGFGVGLTGGTLVKREGLSVEGYEINNTLREPLDM